MLPRQLGCPKPSLLSTVLLLKIAIITFVFQICIEGIKTPDQMGFVAFDEVHLTQGRTCGCKWNSNFCIIAILVADIYLYFLFELLMSLRSFSNSSMIQKEFTK